MARNEEKQQGRLNRLWLQKERDEGRLKNTRDTRPKLCTLNTAASVKKWIPSIKNEIEYYLQQSQLTHYPERKIAEFQLRIEALEKEYKSFIRKLRVLDPSCQQQPWSPRAYRRRRAEQPDSDTSAKKPCTSLTEESGKRFEDRSGGDRTFSNKTEIPDSFTSSEPRKITHSHLDLSNAQDLPLAFDQSRLAVAVAPFRGSSAALDLTQTNNLVRVLQSGLPNLVNSAVRSSNHQNLTGKSESQTAVSAESANSEEATGATEKQISGTALSSRRPAEGAHVLGLDCYSSDDES